MSRLLLFGAAGAAVLAPKVDLGALLCLSCASALVPLSLPRALSVPLGR